MKLVTFDLAHPDDFWLHARGVPGAHVVVRTGGRQLDESTMRCAAQLAAYHSGARGERAVDVICHAAAGSQPGARRQNRTSPRAPGGSVDRGWGVAPNRQLEIDVDAAAPWAVFFAFLVLREVGVSAFDELVEG